MIEHQIGAYTDCPHGAGLAAISVPYYRYIYKYGIDKFVRFARNVWGIDSGLTKEGVANAGIDALASFISELGLPADLKSLGASEEMLPLIAASAVKGGGYLKLNEEDILKILKAAF